MPSLRATKVQGARLAASQRHQVDKSMRSSKPAAKLKTQHQLRDIHRILLKFVISREPVNTRRDNSADACPQKLPSCSMRCGAQVVHKKGPLVPFLL